MRVAERNNRTVCFGPVEQGSFLKRMQGEVRLEVCLFVFLFIMIFIYYLFLALAEERFA